MIIPNFHSIIKNFRTSYTQNHTLALYLKCFKVLLYARNYQNSIPELGFHYCGKYMHQLIREKIGLVPSFQLTSDSHESQQYAVLWARNEP